MKWKLLFLMPALLLTGCASIYIEPKTGETAIAWFSQANFGNPSNLTIDVSSTSCADIPAGKDTRISRHIEHDAIVIPADKPIYVSIYRSALPGFRVIGGEGILFPENDKIFFTPKKGKFYSIVLVRFLEKTRDSRYSAIGVKESDEAKERWVGDKKRAPAGESRIIQVTRCGQDKPSYDLNNINSRFINATIW